MSGLRQRQKADREERILTAAAGLFREAGFDGAKMEAIATRAEVSAGTIYNYYQNKGDLLVAIVAMEVHEVLAAGDRLMARKLPGAIRAVEKLFAIYLEHSLVYLSKEMWRAAMATSTQQPASRFGLIYRELDRQLGEQVVGLIERLRLAEALRPDTDAVAVGQVLFNNMNMMFVSFVKDEDMPIAELLADVMRQSRVVLKPLDRGGAKR